MAQVQLKCKLLIEAAPFLNILTVNMRFNITCLLPKWSETKNYYSLFSLYLIVATENGQN